MVGLVFQKVSTTRTRKIPPRILPENQNFLFASKIFQAFAYKIFLRFFLGISANSFSEILPRNRTSIRDSFRVVNLHELLKEFLWKLAQECHPAISSEVFQKFQYIFPQRISNGHFQEFQEFIQEFYKRLHEFRII